MGLAIDVVTLFPRYFEGPLGESILKRAREKKKLQISVHNLRDYTHDRHRTVDDKPFGGGAGMVLKPEPLFECVEVLKKTSRRPWVILLDPQGEPLTQKIAEKLAKKKRLVLIAGHYEGVDFRVRKHLVDQEISVGDFITMGGEAPALCLIEVVTRLVPGVLGNAESLKHETFGDLGLECPQYTRPREYRGWKAPEILVSGDHKEVEKWRREESKKITRQRRPDLTKS